MVYVENEKVHDVRRIYCYQKREYPFTIECELSSSLAESIKGRKEILKGVEVHVNGIAKDIAFRLNLFRADFIEPMVCHVDAGIIRCEEEVSIEEIECEEEEIE